MALAQAREDLAYHRRQQARGTALIRPQSAIAEEDDEDEDEEAGDPTAAGSAGAEAPGRGYAPGGSAARVGTVIATTPTAAASSSSGAPDPYEPIRPQAFPRQIIGGSESEEVSSLATRQYGLSGPAEGGNTGTLQSAPKRPRYKFHLPLPNAPSNVPSVVMRRAARKQHQIGNFVKAERLASKACEFRRQEILDDCFSTRSLTDLCTFDRRRLFSHTREWARYYKGEFSEDDEVFSPPPNIGANPGYIVYPGHRTRETRTEVADELEYATGNPSPECVARMTARGERIAAEQAAEARRRADASTYPYASAMTTATPTGAASSGLDPCPPGAAGPRALNDKECP